MLSEVMVEGGNLWGILFFASTILSAPSLNKPSTSDTGDLIVYDDSTSNTNTFETNNSSNAGGSLVNNSTRTSITVSNIGNFKTNGSNDARWYHNFVFKNIYLQRKKRQFLKMSFWSVSAMVRGMVRDYEEKYTEVLLLLSTNNKNFRFSQMNVAFLKVLCHNRIIKVWKF